MTHSGTTLRAGGPALGPEVVFCPESVDRALLDAAVRALGHRDCTDLDRMPALGRRPEVADPLRRSAIAWDARQAAVPAGAADRVDAEAVAAWITGRYTADDYPVVVLGSPHGSAVHLAAALGAPWLRSPTCTAAELWLAGSAAFDAVTVLPQPPGTDCAAHAHPRQWAALASFARHDARLDPDAYPLLPLPTGHAARLLRGRTAAPRPAPPAMPVDRALGVLRHRAAMGLLVV